MPNQRISQNCVVHTPNDEGDEDIEEWLGDGGHEDDDMDDIDDSEEIESEM